MQSDVMRRLRDPREKFRNALMILFGILFWLLILAVCVGLIMKGRAAALLVYAAYVVLAVLISLIAAAFYRARAFGHFVLLSERQFPHLHAMVTEGAAALGFKTPPRAFLFNSNGVFNAHARRLLGKRYVFLTSALVEADTDAQIRFVIGHELGHHAAGHLAWGKNLLKLPAHAVPFLGPAYARSRELTCDRVGAYLAQDPHAARSALQMLACGCARLNASMDADAFELQEEMVPPIAGWLLNAFSHYPRTTRRVRAVRSFMASRDAAPAAPAMHAAASPAE